MKLSSETDYQNNLSCKFSERWSQVSEGIFQGVDDKKLSYMSLTGFSSKQAIVFISGRRETYLKHKELFWELTENGFDVFTYDHRGQGLSERLTGNKEVGYVDDFNDYVDDLEIFMQQIVLPKGYQQLYLVSHSMGGTIASQYLIRSPKTFACAVLSSPMMGIYLPPLNRKWAMYISKLLAKKALRPDYVITQGPYEREPFVGNPLTSSRLRYNNNNDVFDLEPKTKLGGPSPWWIYQGLKAGLDIIKNATKIETPILVLRGSRDKVVENSAQDDFMKELTKSNSDALLTEIKGAKHELFSESDEYRGPVMTYLFEFLEKHK